MIHSHHQNQRLFSRTVNTRSVPFFILLKCYVFGFFFSLEPCLETKSVSAHKNNAEKVDWEINTKSRFFEHPIRMIYQNQLISPMKNAPPKNGLKPIDGVSRRKHVLTSTDKIPFIPDKRPKVFVHKFIIISNEMGQCEWTVTKNGTCTGESCGRSGRRNGSCR